MSQRNKLSLWQKLKRLLTASAPQSIIDGAKMPTQSSAADNDIDMMQAEISSANAHNSDETNTADSTGSFTNRRDNNDSERSQANAKLKASQHEPNDTSIVDCLKQYFSKNQWQYTYYRPRNNNSQ